MSTLRKPKNFYASIGISSGAHRVSVLHASKAITNSIKGYWVNKSKVRRWVVIKTAQILIFLESFVPGSSFSISPSQKQRVLGISDVKTFCDISCRFKHFSLDATICVMVKKY